MRNASSIGWTCLVVALFAAITPILRADDKPTSTDADGYKTVRLVGADGKPTYIRVQTQPQLDAHLSSSDADGKYDPSQYSLNKTSSFADKTFPIASLSPNNNAEAPEAQRTFITKSYIDSSTNQTTLTAFNSKATYPETTAYNRTASDFNKDYPADQTDAAQNKTAAFPTGTSEYQDRTFNLGDHKFDTSVSSLADKTYTGPEAASEQRALSKLNQGLMDIKDLPNRPLTIDEVRALINHDIKPNTDAPPPTVSKPLNDPDYKPEPAPPLPPPDTSDEDIPSPGTMAAQHLQAEPPPENSEPLPK